MGDQRSDPPGAVSDQNTEEQPSGVRDDRRHPEPREDGRSGGGEKHERAHSTKGESKEGSQSTGHPQNAG